MTHIKNTTLSIIKGMKRSGSGIEFEVMIIERAGDEVKEYMETFHADGKFVVTYLQEFSKIERSHANISTLNPKQVVNNGKP
jgi:hypothetical protein